MHKTNNIHIRYLLNMRSSRCKSSANKLVLSDEGSNGNGQDLNKSIMDYAKSSKRKVDDGNLETITTKARTRLWQEIDMSHVHLREASSTIKITAALVWPISKWKNKTEWI